MFDFLLLNVLADFTTGMTSVSDVDDSIIEEWDKAFTIAYDEMGQALQYVTYKKQIGSKQISIPRYDNMSLATTPLTDKEDLDSEVLSDSDVTLTPAEYGNVVTKTLLASMQTGGIVDSAAAKLVAINMGRTENKLALLAADASTNIRRVNGRATTGEVLVGDIASGTELGILYNKLRRASVPPLAGNKFVFICHDDVAHDLREESGAGSWQDINKYTSSEPILSGEIGTYKGFKIVTDMLSLLSEDAGDSNVDVYTSYAIGFNALGWAVSKPGTLRISGPFDKLGRFLNVGWFALEQFKIIEQQALWTLQSSSSIGSNA